MLIKDLLLAKPVLQRLNNEKMPAKLAYAMAKNFRLVNQELEDFEKARKKMLEDNYEFDEKNNKYIIPPEKEAEAQKMFDELINATVQFIPYQIPEFWLFDQLQLTPGEVMAIEWMLKLEE